MGGVDRLSQVRKPMVLIENRSDTDTSNFNAYLLYKHNCKLFDMPPKELLDFRAELVNLLIRRSRNRKRPVFPQSSSHSRDGVPGSCSLWKLAYREESVATAWMWADVQFITPPLPALFVKFVSTRFPVLQTVTRTELYVVSC